MTRKDDILKSFLEHEILEEKYNISKDDLVSEFRDAQASKIPIIKAIALIIEDKEGTSSTDKDLYKKINRYLNEVAI